MSDVTGPDGEQIAKWVRRLRGEDDARRVHAAMRLAAPGLDLAAVVPSLQEALLDADPQVRKLAAYVLGRVGKEREAA
jgi:HEAT repeat protein